MRVVAGRLKGRKIQAPDSGATRPTTDKVREAVFNALNSLDVIDGAKVVDLFAGSGALGIEALSRGASHCVFVERDKSAVAALRANITALGLDAQSTVMVTDALSGASVVDECDIVLADPPYGWREWDALLASRSAGLAVLESDRPIGDVSGWRVLRERRYGRTFVAFLEPDTRSKGTVEGA